MLVIINLLRSNAFLTVNKVLANNIGLECACFYQELASKQDFYIKCNKLTKDGFFYATIDEMKKETGLSDYKQRKIIDRLVELKLIEFKLQDMPAKRYFKLIQDEELIKSFLTDEPQSFEKIQKLNSNSNKKTQKLILKDSKTYIKPFNINNNNYNNNSDLYKYKSVSESYDSQNNLNTSPFNNIKENNSTIEIVEIEGKPFINTISKNTLQLDEASTLVKRCLSIHFRNLKIKSPRVQQEKHQNEKELYKVNKLITCLLYGFPHKQFTSLYDWAVKQKNERINSIIEKGLKDSSKVLKLVKDACLCYKDGYSPDDKSYLPNRLSDFIYSVNATMKSKLLHYACNIKKMEEVKIIDDKNGNITQRYVNEFLNGIDITSKNKNRLIRNVAVIVNEHKKMNPVLIKNGSKYPRFKFEDVDYNLHELNELIDLHLEYLNSRVDCDKGVQMVDCENGWWKGFVSYVSKTYDIQLYKSKQQLQEELDSYLNMINDVGKF